MIIVCVSADDESGAPPWRPSLLGAANHSPESKRLVVGSGATASSEERLSMVARGCVFAVYGFIALHECVARGGGREVPVGQGERERLCLSVFEAVAHS